MISRRTRDALAAKKAQGVKLGGLNAKGIENRDAALDRAEKLRLIFDELAGMTACGENFVHLQNELRESDIRWLDARQ